MGQFLIYLGAFLLFFWGIAHLFPTRSVVEGFGDISPDNRRIITISNFARSSLAALRF